MLKRKFFKKKHVRKKVKKRSELPLIPSDYGATGDGGGKSTPMYNIVESVKVIPGSIGWNQTYDN
jgi:hypothetical protein